MKVLSLNPSEGGVGSPALLGTFKKGGLFGSRACSSSMSGCQETDLRVLAEPYCERPWPVFPSGFRSSQEHILVVIPSYQS